MCACVRNRICFKLAFEEHGVNVASIIRSFAVSVLYCYKWSSCRTLLVCVCVCVCVCVHKTLRDVAILRDGLLSNCRNRLREVALTTGLVSVNSLIGKCSYGLQKNLDFFLFFFFIKNKTQTLLFTQAICCVALLTSLIKKGTNTFLRCIMFTVYTVLEKK